MFTRAFLLLIALSLQVTGTQAKSFNETFPGLSYENTEAQKFAESLNYLDGVIALGTSGVQLRVPQNFYFLAADHARRVITEAWGNPPAAAESVLGMIMPAGKTPLDDTWVQSSPSTRTLRLRRGCSEHQLFRPAQGHAGGNATR